MLSSATTTTIDRDETEELGKALGLDFALTFLFLPRPFASANKPAEQDPPEKVLLDAKKIDLNLIKKEFDEEGKISDGMSGMRLSYFGARYYDAEIGVWGSTDAGGQFWSPYAYAGNPVSMVDPDGNFFFGNGPATWTMLYSDAGYDLQKMISPVAFHINLSMGSEQIGAGFDASIGAPTLSPISYRKQFGATYRSSFYDNSYSGWETRNGGETSTAVLGGIPLTYSGTRVTSGGFSQHIQRLRVGIPLMSFTYENDGSGAMITPGIGNALTKLPGDRTGDTDAWRTAAAKADLGLIGIPGVSAGLNLFTGNPADATGNKVSDIFPDGHKYYNRGTADQYRAGVFWVGAGPLRVGWNSEGIRHVFQNLMIHDPYGIPRFTVLNRKPRPYFYFGSGTGSTLW